MEPELDLLRRVAAGGDAEALGDLFRRHHPAVLRVTQALLQQGADAEDAAQDTFLAAMQEAHGFRSEGSVRGWLLRIARNVAIDRRRSRHAPAPLGSRAAEDASDPAAAAAAADWERILLRALLDLPAGFRNPLVLRYWDGQPLTAIAEHLGIPRSTAHQRCRQGLDLLRARLDRRAWTSLPLFLGTLPGLAKVLASAAAASPLATFGVALMTAKNATLATVLVVAGAASVGFFALRERPNEPAPVRALEGGTSTVAAPVLPAAAVGGPPAAPPAAGNPIAATPFAGDTEPTLPPGSWRVRGRVVIGSKRAPAPAGTVVRARLHEGWWDEVWEVPGTPTVETTLAVREGGRFFWDLADPRRTITLAYQAEAEGCLAVDDRSLVLRGAGPPPEIELMVHPLDRTIEGTVRDPEGRPIPEPWVGWWRSEIRGDAEGRYRLAVTGSFADVRIRASAPGFATTTETCTVAAPGVVAHQDLVLAPEGVISGCVLDTEARPIAGATVSSWEGRPKSMTTGADGAFRIGGLPRARMTGLHASAPGYAARHLIVQEIPPAGITKDLVLARGTAVTGTVVDDAGVPVEGVRLGLGADFDVADVLKTISGEDGRFSFRDAPPGPTGIHAARDGFAQSDLEISVPSHPDGIRDLRIILARGQELRGRVLDEAGTPVAGARIALKRHGEYLEARAATGAGGDFVLRGVEGPEAELEIYGRGLERAYPKVKVGAERVTITVKRHGVLAGRVFDAATGEPLARFRIRLVEGVLQEGDARCSGFTADLTQRGRWFDSAAGAWTIDNEEIAVGSVCGIEVWSDGCAAVVVPRVVAAARPDPDAAVARLPRASVLIVTVLDAAAREPLSGASVRWRPADGRAPEWSSWDLHESGTRRTDDGGRIRFDDVLSGGIVIDVRVKGRPFFRDDPVTVPVGGQETQRVIIVPRGATVSGVVQDGKGRPVGLAAVRLDPADGTTSALRFSYDATADGDGRFRLEGVAPGRWRASRSHAFGNTSFYLYSVEFDVPSDGISDVRLRPEGSASLVVVVTCEGPLPAGLIVHTIPAADASRTAGSRRGQSAVVAGGRAVFDALPDGEWTVMSQVIGGPGTADRRARAEVRLSPGEAASITLVLPR